MEGKITLPVDGSASSTTASITFTDLRTVLFKLGLSHTPVIAHASLKSFGEVIGGADAVLRAVLDSVWALVMPTFTYVTMVTPEVGPPNNGIAFPPRYAGLQADGHHP